VICVHASMQVCSGSGLPQQVAPGCTVNLYSITTKAATKALLSVQGAATARQWMDKLRHPPRAPVQANYVGLARKLSLPHTCCLALAGPREVSKGLDSLSGRLPLKPCIFSHKALCQWTLQFQPQGPLPTDPAILCLPSQEPHFPSMGVGCTVIVQVPPTSSHVCMSYASSDEQASLGFALGTWEVGPPIISGMWVC